MADYRVIYTNLKTGSILGQLPSANVSIQHALNSPGSVSVTMPLEPDNPVTKEVVSSYWESILTDSPVALFKMNDTSTVMADSSGFSRSGTYVSDPTQEATGPSSRIGSAVTFDATADYAVVSAPEAEALDFQGDTPFSVEFWLYVPSTPTTGDQYVSNHDGTDGWYFQNNASGELEFVRDVGGSADTVLSTLTTAAWHHIVGTYGDGVLKLYVDGTMAQDLGSITGSLPATAVDVTVNTEPAKTTFAGCTMAGLALYNTELSGTRVSEHYQLGMGTLLDTLDVDLPDPIGTNTLTPGAVGLYVERDGTIVWGGILWATQADVGGNTLTLAGEGFLSYFRRRLITADALFDADTDYQENIANSLLTTAQAVTGGDLSISTTTVTSGTKRDRSYLGYEFNNVGESIENLSNLQDGFDFYFSSSWVSGSLATSFVTQYPATGRSTEHVFELGVNVSILNVGKNGTTLATTAYATGAGNALGGDDSQSESASSATMLDTYPVIEVVENHPDVRHTSTLQNKADRRQTRGSQPMENLTLEVYADTIPSLGSYLVGDLVEVRGSQGVLVVSGTYRIMTIGVSVNTSGQETISISLVPSGVFA